MKVILRESVKTLGSVGEIVNVSPGYARNYLIPQNKAMLADEGNTKRMADFEKMLAKKVEEQKNLAVETQKKLNGFTLELIKKVGGSGTLFGTVTANELSRELEKNGIEVEKRQIFINVPIKTVGTYEIQAKLFKDVEATFNVKVDMSEKQREEMLAKQKEAAKKKAAKAKAAEEAAANAETTEDAETTEESTESTEA